MDTLRVLVTDDEMGMRLGVVRTLRDFIVHVSDVNEDVAFVVDQAESGEEALEKIRRQPPDILLLDHKMPGISGLDVLDQLADMQTDMLTIMITAYASIETAVTATKRGAYDFLAKPFTPDELKSTIRKTAARLILAKQARKLAEEKRQVRFEFIRVLGHELKAPLNAVAGYLELMKERRFGDELAAYAEMLDRSLVRIDSMHKLIRDLLDLTQIESGRKNRQLVAVDLRAMAQAAIEAVHADAVEQHIAISLEADGPVPMMADACEIEMILNNLLSNAVKYNRCGGRVLVAIMSSGCEKTGTGSVPTRTDSVEIASGEVPVPLLSQPRNGSQVAIRVTDTGIGMTADEASRLFGEFVRIKNEKTSHILGSGLGLSIVKKLAQLYSGEVRVESEPDAGSAFTVVLAAGD